MKIIILAAGIGSRLKPLTQKVPKSLLVIGNEKMVLQRNIEMIKKNCDAEIVVVTGYYSEKIDQCIEGICKCKAVYNPFYRITNSIASLWFAKEEMNDDLIIMNADVVVEEKLFKYILNIKDEACVLYDSSIGDGADYKVAEKNGQVVVMSKELNDFSGEYVGITKFSKNNAIKLSKKVEEIIESELFNEWYETALVDMIFNNNFKLRAIDVNEYNWTEIDNVNDLLKAKEILEYEKDK